MSIEEIYTGKADFKLYRVTEENGEYLYIILCQGELIFLREVSTKFLETFYGYLNQEGRKKEDED